MRHGGSKSIPISASLKQYEVFSVGERNVFAPSSIEIPFDLLKGLGGDRRWALESSSVVPSHRPLVFVQCDGPVHWLISIRVLDTFRPQEKVLPRIESSNSLNHFSVQSCEGKVSGQKVGLSYMLRERPAKAVPCQSFKRPCPARGG